MPFYSNTSDVRERARNVLADEFPNSEIEEIQEAFYTLINIKTHRHAPNQWTIADPEFKTIQLIEEQLAAADIKKHYGDDDQKAIGMSEFDQAMALLQTIIDESPTVDIDSATLEISRTDYLTHELNNDVPISRGRLRSGLF